VSWYDDTAKKVVKKVVKLTGDKLNDLLVRIPANVTGHSGDRDRFAHGHHAGVGFVL
jgi:hypothetical protein